MGGQGKNLTRPTLFFRNLTYKRPKFFLILVLYNFMKTETPNLQECTIEFKGKEIKVTNWWNWKLQGAADLYLDGEHLDKNTDKIANPKKILLSKYNYSEDIKSIEVYASYFFKLKLKILVNGNIVYKD